MGILDSILDIAKATPPVDNKLSRFGNPAFKIFYDRIAEVSEPEVSNSSLLML